MISTPSPGIALITPSPYNNYEWNMKIHGPTDSPYDGGLFDLNVTFPSSYPFQEPRLRFDTPIYHHNVDERTGAVL